MFGERIEVGEVLEHTGAVTEPEALFAVHALGATPVLPRSQRAQGAVESFEGLHQVGGAEGLSGQGVELGPLLGGHRVAEALGGSRPGRQGVDQLVDVARLLGERRTVFRHEVVELLGGVLAPSVGVEQIVQVVQHLADGLAVGVGGVLEGGLHPREALVEHLATEQVFDLLVGLPGLPALPSVLGELGDGTRGGRRKAVELEVGERAIAVVEVDVAGELCPFGAECPVEQLTDLLQRAVEVVVARQGPPSFGDLTGEVVEAGPVTPSPPQELAECGLGARSRHDVASDGVEGFGEIGRRRERVGPVGIPLVARGSAQPPIRPSHVAPQNP